MKSTIWWACFLNSSGSKGLNSRWGEEESVELKSRLPILVFDGEKEVPELIAGTSSQGDDEEWAGWRGLN